MKLVNESKSKIVPAREMKIGQLAYIREDKHPFLGHIILRHYSGYVSLTDPQRSWSDFPRLDVQIIEKGTELTFEVEV